MTNLKCIGSFTLSGSSTQPSRNDQWATEAHVLLSMITNAQATKLSANSKLVSPEVHSIKLVSGESIFHDVLREFPEIVQPPSFSQENGTTLRLLSDLFFTDKITTTCNQTYASFLREKMRALQPIPTSAHSKSSMFLPNNLNSRSHVFLRVDSVQPPLSQNYIGPHEVIRRTDQGRL
ncbi:transposon Tf2-6 polyprotein [Trichonephila inaurata madagascariensis]|uniref:Transposon Tf2-6 polyprotein n=1 Tax=Trichonephila inaurata madagascariensis TaxID=2747483 RepID=A0A8X7CHF9_9ARAC|nr:transposon Tf2-6 polyprotein [Trichonephila inaurata madagascariensis]